MVRFDICWEGMVDFTVVAIIGWVRGACWIGMWCGVGADCAGSWIP